MSEQELPSELESQIRRIAEEGRTQIETRVFRQPTAFEQSRLFLLRSLGAAAIGLASAGFSILAIVVLLNLVFHFAPA